MPAGNGGELAMGVAAYDLAVVSLGAGYCLCKADNPESGLPTARGTYRTLVGLYFYRGMHRRGF